MKMLTNMLLFQGLIQLIVKSISCIILTNAITAGKKIRVDELKNKW